MAGRSYAPDKVSWKTTIINGRKHVERDELLALIGDRVCRFRTRIETSTCACKNGVFPFKYDVQMLEASPVESGGWSNSSCIISGLEPLNENRMEAAKHLASCDALIKEANDPANKFHYTLADGTSGTITFGTAGREKQTTKLTQDVEIISVFGDKFGLDLYDYSDHAGGAHPNHNRTWRSVTLPAAGNKDIALEPWWWRASAIAEQKFHKEEQAVQELYTCGKYLPHPDWTQFVITPGAGGAHVEFVLKDQTSCGDACNQVIPVALPENELTPYIDCKRWQNSANRYADKMPILPGSSKRNISFYSQSPDGREAVFVENHKLFLYDPKKGTEQIGTADNIRCIQWLPANRLNAGDAKALSL